MLAARTWRARGTAGPPGTAEQPQAIWLNEAEDIAGRVHDLIRAGRVEPAWDLVRRLHPADMASILAGLSGMSRDALLRVMSPETVVWMLRQMNPVEAGRVGRRLGSHVLSSVLHEIHPQHALDTLRRLPSLRTREVIAALRRSGAEGDLLAHEPDTAGVLMADEFPAVPITDTVGTARDHLRALGDAGYGFTHILVLGDAEELVGQVSIVDLAVAGDETPLRTLSSALVATVTTDTPAEECA